MSLPFAHAWMEVNKDKRRIVVVDPSLRDLVERCHFLAEIWTYSKAERPRLLERLKREKATSVTMMTNSWGSILPYWKAQVPHRIGFGGPMTRWLFTEPGPRSALELPQGERWFKLLGPQGDDWVQKPVPYLAPAQWDQGAKPELLLFPGAKYGPAKQWSHESYAELASLALQAQWRVVLVGTPDEVKDAQAIQALLPQPVEDWCGRFKLNALLEEVSKMSRPVVLANDSGAMHLMAAMGVPTLGLYFSTSAKNTPPAFGLTKILEADIACRPCYERECPKGHYQCRERLSPTQVWSELTSLLS